MEKKMETKVKTTDTGIEIDITKVEDKKDKLLEAFQECQEGRCTCHTDEYKKVESLEIRADDDAIQLRITAKPDEKIDTAEIEKCLDYTKKRASE